MKTTYRFALSAFALPFALACSESTGPGVGNEGTNYPGYLASATWGGSIFTATEGAGTTISQGDFSQTYAPFCVAGSVAPQADHGGFVLLAANLNQVVGEAAVANTVTPTGAGIEVGVTNQAGSTLRLQIQGPAGMSDPNDRWCAEVPAGGGVIAFSDFNTECWGSGGTAYAGQPLVSAGLVVPGTADAAVNYDFCLNSLSEFFPGQSGSGGGTGSGGSNATGAATGSGGGSATGGTGGGDDGIGLGYGEIADPYGRKHVVRNGQDYIIQNNVWAHDQYGINQTIDFQGTSFEITSITGSAPHGQVLSYPSIWLGSNHGDATTGSNLPIQVSQIQSIDTSWTWSADGVSGSYNASYDVWFSTTSAGDAQGPSGGFLMVWMYKPGDQYPLGEPWATVTGTATIAGVTWDIYKGMGSGPGGKPIINYVAKNAIYDLDFDLNDFIEDAVSQGYVQDSWYLSNVFAGFEIWNGGVGLRTEQFHAIVE